MTLGDFRRVTAKLPDSTSLLSGALDYYYKRVLHKDVKRPEKTEPDLSGYAKLADFILHGPQQNRNET